MINKTKKKIDGPKKVCVFRAPRGKKKSVTVVVGLNTFGKTFLLKPNKFIYNFIFRY